MGKMIGVVLWCDPCASKAVFWCEDHGDLAYYAADPVTEPQAAGLTAGDLVQFDVTPKPDYREARNARLLQQDACRGLKKMLRRTADEACKLEIATETSKVIALNFNGEPRRRGRKLGGRAG